MHDVLARVGELLGRQRARVPAREARGLGHAQAEHVGQQRVVGGLRAQPGEAGRDLRVEDVASPRVSSARAQQRDVLAPGVHDDLDRGVGEHAGERRAVEVLGQRVDERDPLAAVARPATRAGSGTAACGSGPRP